VLNFIKLSAAVHELSCKQRKKTPRNQYCRRYRGLPQPSKLCKVNVGLSQTNGEAVSQFRACSRETSASVVDVGPSDA